MEKSSIEKLHEESSELVSKHLKGELSARDLIVMHHNLYYEAKEKHKQEIIDAHKDGGFLLVLQSKQERAEKYYVKTFKSE